MGARARSADAIAPPSAGDAPLPPELLRNEILSSEPGMLESAFRNDAVFAFAAKQCEFRARRLARIDCDMERLREAHAVDAYTKVQDTARLVLQLSAGIEPEIGFQAIAFQFALRFLELLTARIPPPAST